MALHISVAEANSWTDHVKLNLTTLDAELEGSISTQVIALISQAYDTTSWIDAASTPSLVRKIIAMQYVGWYFQRTYSEDADVNSYGLMLIAQSKNIIDGIANGSIVIPDAPSGTNAGLSQPAFYPTDASSSQYLSDENTVATWIDPNPDTSVGPQKFSMGQIW